MPTDTALPTPSLGESPGTTGVTIVGRRCEVPADLSLINMTVMEEPLRKMVTKDETWVTMETRSTPQFLVESVARPMVVRLGQWCARRKAVIPPEIAPVVKRRIVSGIPEGSPDALTGECFRRTLDEAPAFLEKPDLKRIPNAPWKCAHYSTRPKGGRTAGSPDPTGRSGCMHRLFAPNRINWRSVLAGD